MIASHPYPPFEKSAKSISSLHIIYKHARRLEMDSAYWGWPLGVGKRINKSKKELPARARGNEMSLSQYSFFHL